MPKLREATKRLRAKRLAKKLIKANGSINKVAREEGVLPQVICKKAGTKEVQEALRELLDKADATDKKYARVLSEGMDANDLEIIFQGRGKKREPIKIESPDHSIRLKAAELYAKTTRIISATDQAKPTGFILVIPGGRDSIL